MANPLAQSIAVAERAGHDYKKIFGQLGTREHPRGSVLVAYRNARRALRDVLRNPSFTVAGEVSEVLNQLRRDVSDGIAKAVDAGAQVGINSANRQATIYKGQLINAVPNLQVQKAAQVSAVLSAVDTQIAAARGVVTNPTIDAALLIGDAARLGIVQPAPVLKSAVDKVVAVGSIAWGLVIGEIFQPDDRFMKQAIAALDERTTDCCLKVHGQIQPLNKPFKLTGVPRYANELQEPPFHWYCRTAFALYAGQYDDGLTEAMKASAKIVLNERAAGINLERHPADAFA
jgi:hypothetical protein